MIYYTQRYHAVCLFSHLGTCQHGISPNSVDEATKRRVSAFFSGSKIPTHLRKFTLQLPTQAQTVQDIIVSHACHGIL
jgi:hypothetical protein